MQIVEAPVEAPRSPVRWERGLILLLLVAGGALGATAYEQGRRIDRLRPIAVEGQAAADLALTTAQAVGALERRLAALEVEPISTRSWVAKPAPPATSPKTTAGPPRRYVCPCRCALGAHPMVAAVKRDLSPSLVLLSIRARDLVRVGDRFTIFRGATFVGTVVVERVVKDAAGCRAVTEDGAFRVGDAAVFRPRPANR